MKMLSRVVITGAAALALGGLGATPAASASTVTSAAPSSGVQIMRTWHATVQCQIVRISDNHVVGYERADGSGNTKEAAIQDAQRNIPVPAGHYKRHCDTKRIW